MILTGLFVVLPVVLRDGLGLAAAHHWWVYLPVLLGSFVLMVPAIIYGERRHRLRQVFLLAIGLLVAALAFIWGFHQGLWGLALALLLMFTAFNILEASLPSLVSKIAPPQAKGAAMGVYSSAQFFGAFLGGIIGGAVHGGYGVAAVFLLCVIMAALWLLIAFGMSDPRYLTSYSVSLGELDEAHATALADHMDTLSGVHEAVVLMEERMAYLKVDPQRFDQAQLAQIQSMIHSQSSGQV